MKHPRVSVVVPIYNVEPYLKKCVESLLSQTLEDIEILLVDDGSPDRCGEIADEYAAREPQVKAFHQKNAGLGPARNTGIEHATGEYVGFVDSDDWVDSQMFERLYSAAAKCDADIVVGGHRDVVEGHVRVAKPHPLAGVTLHGSDEIMPVRNRLFGHAEDDNTVEAFPMRVWTAIYRNDFLRTNRLRFEEILSEDTIFNLPAYKTAKTITFTGDTNYCYRMDNQSSIMRTFSPTKLKRYEAFLDRLWQLAQEESWQHDECLQRVKRTAIDYCRLYAGMIAGSEVSRREKIIYLRQLGLSRLITEYCAGYPVNVLPSQQRLFHEALVAGHYGIALALLEVRRVLKKKVWK